MAKIAQHRVLVLRSGPTEWDDSGRLQGSTDLPLSKSGLAQAQRDVALLGRPPLVAVLSAPDEGCLTTAGLLAAATRSKVVALPDLVEVNFGLWEGMLRRELEGRFCRAGRQWDDDPAFVTPPDGECFDAFSERLLGALRKGLAKASGRRGSELAGGIAVVLRPVADALVRCVLSRRPSSEMCSVIEARPAARWFEVPADQAWGVKIGVGQVSAAAAA